MPPLTLSTQGRAALRTSPLHAPSLSVDTALVKPLPSLQVAVSVAPVIGAPTAATPDSALVGAGVGPPDEELLLPPQPARTSGSPAMTSNV